MALTICHQGSLLGRIPASLIKGTWPLGGQRAKPTIALRICIGQAGEEPQPEQVILGCISFWLGQGLDVHEVADSSCRHLIGLSARDVAMVHQIAFGGTCECGQFYNGEAHLP